MYGWGIIMIAQVVINIISIIIIIILIIVFFLSTFFDWCLVLNQEVNIMLNYTIYLKKK